MILGSTWLAFNSFSESIICLTKTTVAQNDDALSYHRVRGQYFMAVIFVSVLQ